MDIEGGHVPGINFMSLNDLFRFCGRLESDMEALAMMERSES